MNRLDYDIIRACAIGDIEYVKEYINKGTNLNEVSNNGWTPLICAVENDKMEMVELLLNNGTDVNFQNIGRWTALHQAVDISIDGTIQTRGKQGDEPLDMIKYLLDNGADVNIKDNHGRTPFDIAMLYKSKKIIEFLKDYQGI